MKNQSQPFVPFKVGDHATYCIYTDCHAGYITKVSKSGTTVWFQPGKATLLNGINSKEPDALQCAPGGFSGCVFGTQRWKIEPDPEAKPDNAVRFSWRAGVGKWKLAGHSSKSPGCALTSGHHHHYDYNF